MYRYLCFFEVLFSVYAYFTYDNEIPRDKSVRHDNHHSKTRTFGLIIVACNDKCLDAWKHVANVLSGHSAHLAKLGPVSPYHAAHVIGKITRDHMTILHVIIL